MLRIYYNYILYILGVRNVLPSYIINTKVVQECGEPLVELSGPGIFCAKGVVVRKSVAKMLGDAAQNLRVYNYALFVYEGYRSNEKQELAWERELLELAKVYPDKSKSELEGINRKQVAKPNGIGGGHQTGGAVDLTLCLRDGTPLFMGTDYLEFNELTKTLSVIDDAEVKKRRHIFSKIMKEVGFVNYPNEWWHYSYGDRMWAAYARKKHALYGVVTSKADK